jgi:hypothetical protein
MVTRPVILDLMKEQLVQLIVAYGAAQSSGNALLKQMAGAQLDSFLENVELTKPAPATFEVVAAEVEAN